MSIIVRYVVFDCINKQEVTEPLLYEAARLEAERRLELLHATGRVGRFRIDEVFINYAPSKKADRKKELEGYA